MSKTTLSNMVNPEVMEQMISAELPKAIKMTPLANIDTTLEGQAGDTVTMPRFKYIGDAKDVAEGEKIDTAQLTTDTTKVTVKKAGLSVDLTDEALLSGYGDPRGESARQLALSIASKVDNDLMNAALGAKLKVKGDVTKVDVIDTIEDTFTDNPDTFNTESGEAVNGVLVLNPKDVRKLRKSASNDWTRSTELGDSILVNGVIGQLLGWQILSSRKVEEGTGIAVKPNALQLTMKRDLLVEASRDAHSQINSIIASELYAASVRDDTRVVVVSKTVSDSPVKGDTPAK